MHPDLMSSAKEQFQNIVRKAQKQVKGQGDQVPIRRNSILSTADQDQRNILLKPGHLRTEEEVQILGRNFGRIKFLKDIDDNFGHSYFTSLLQKISYDFVEMGKNVVLKNTKGQQFYIILKGWVSIVDVPENMLHMNKLPEIEDIYLNQLIYEEEEKAREEKNQKNLHQVNHKITSPVQSPRQSKIEIQGQVKKQIEKQLTQNQENNYVPTQFTEIQVLGRGDSFGEIAFYTKFTLRTATVMAKTDCSFAVLFQKDYLKIIGKLQSELINAKFSFLRQLPVFSENENADLRRFSFYTYQELLGQNGVLYRQGDQVDDFYLIFNGEISLFKEQIEHKKTLKGLEDIYNSEQTISREVMRIGKGEFFGTEMFEDEDNKRKYTAKGCSIECQLFRISQFDFQNRLGGKGFGRFLEMIEQKNIFNQEFTRKLIRNKKKNKQYEVKINEYEENLGKILLKDEGSDHRPKVFFYYQPNRENIHKFYSTSHFMKRPFMSEEDDKIKLISQYNLNIDFYPQRQQKQNPEFGSQLDNNQIVFSNFQQNLSDDEDNQIKKENNLLTIRLRQKLLDLKNRNITDEQIRIKSIKELFSSQIPQRDNEQGQLSKREQGEQAVINEYSRRTKFLFHNTMEVTSKLEQEIQQDFNSVKQKHNQTIKKMSQMIKGRSPNPNEIRKKFFLDKIKELREEKRRMKKMRQDRLKEDLSPENVLQNDPENEKQEDQIEQQSAQSKPYLRSNSEVAKMLANHNLIGSDHNKPPTVQQLFLQQNSNDFQTNTPPQNNQVQQISLFHSKSIQSNSNKTEEILKSPQIAPAAGDIDDSLYNFQLKQKVTNRKKENSIIKSQQNSLIGQKAHGLRRMNTEVVFFNNEQQLNKSRKFDEQDFSRVSDQIRSAREIQLQLIPIADDKQENNEEKKNEFKEFFQNSEAQSNHNKQSIFFKNQNQNKETDDQNNKAVDLLEQKEPYFILKQFPDKNKNLKESSSIVSQSKETSHPQKMPNKSNTIQNSNNKQFQTRITNCTSKFNSVHSAYMNEIDNFLSMKSLHGDQSGQFMNGFESSPNRDQRIEKIVAHQNIFRALRENFKDPQAEDKEEITKAQTHRATMQKELSNSSLQEQNRTIKSPSSYLSNLIFGTQKSDSVGQLQSPPAFFVSQFSKSRLTQTTTHRESKEFAFTSAINPQSVCCMDQQLQITNNHIYVKKKFFF